MSENPKLSTRLVGVITQILPGLSARLNTRARRWIRAAGNWTGFRALPNLVEVGFHWSDRGPRECSYWEAMADVGNVALTALREAQEQGRDFVLFTHGASTSGPFKTTARSVIRGLMRGPVATPYVIRKACIQHETVFVAAIRPKQQSEPAVSAES